jgi:hypothetical protein
VSPHDRHVELDDLAIRALGEPLPEPAAGHLADCVRCQSALDQISATVIAARGITADDQPSPPPDHVWQAIRSEAFGPHGPTPLARRIRAKRRWTFPLAPVAFAGAAASVVAVVGVALISGTGQADPPATLAGAELAALDSRGVSGTAGVVTASAGRTLELSVDSLPPQDGAFYEVWLISPDVTRMVSLGAVSGTGGSLPIPEGLDLTGYPIVDISLEPLDGDPVHSKVSLARGELRA